jgi:hypothetical protein
MYAFQVDRLFEKASDRHEENRTNPVTGGRWVNGVDPVKPQKQAAERALRARAWFAVENPGMPPLPLSYGEREDLKHGGLPHLVAWFSESLNAREYDFSNHVSFETYARGVMASPYAPDFIKEDQQLLKQYPPRPLRGLGPGLIWRPG